MQWQLRSFRYRGSPGTRNISLSPRLFAVVDCGGNSGNPLPYCKNAPICQFLVTSESTRLLNHFCVSYTILRLNRYGWSVLWIVLLELSGLNRSCRVRIIAFDQVKVPLV